MSGSSSRSQVGRILWALPMTLLGVVLVAAGVLTGGRAAIVSGAIEAHGGVIRRGLRLVPVGGGGAGALTLGHVVLGTDAEALERSRRHERVHVAQYEQWGPLFPCAYAAASLSALLRDGNAYRGNRFEKEARTKSRAV